LDFRKWRDFGFMEMQITYCAVLEEGSFGHGVVITCPMLVDRILSIPIAQVVKEGHIFSLSGEGLPYDGGKVRHDNVFSSSPSNVGRTTCSYKDSPLEFLFESPFCRLSTSADYIACHVS
jgi:hypothetical protein